MTEIKWNISYLSSTPETPQQNSSKKFSTKKYVECIWTPPWRLQSTFMQLINIWKQILKLFHTLPL
jgi:hypothetical protein